MAALPNKLAEIIAHKRHEMAGRKCERPLVEFQRQPPPSDPQRHLAPALTRLPGGPVRIIGEVKHKSPSAGVIRPDFDPAQLAIELQLAGVDAISVLTDEHFFGGRLDYLAAIRNVVELPLVCKDFIIDEYQIWEARAYGADAFLLIADVLDDEALRDLVKLGWQLGLEPLVEAHEEEALRRAIDSGARLLGVNNRNLRNFRVDLDTTTRLAALVPAERILVAESGIATADDVARVLAAGAQAVLVGESLMRTANPAALVGEFKTAR